MPLYGLGQMSLIYDGEVKRFPTHCPYMIFNLKMGNHWLIFQRFFL
jgi:hypothetical protein